MSWANGLVIGDEVAMVRHFAAPVVGVVVRTTATQVTVQARRGAELRFIRRSGRGFDGAWDSKIEPMTEEIRAEIAVREQEVHASRLLGRLAMVSGAELIAAGAVKDLDMILAKIAEWRSR